jgi:ribosomal protein S17E
MHPTATTTKTTVTKTNQTMPTDVEKVVDGFPHPIIAPITGVPNYESINALNLQLNANAASVQSNLGDGLLGLLYLTITSAEYNALSATEFIPPKNPGATPTIPYAATDSQLATLLQEHKAATNLFKEYIATDKELKQQVIAAVDTMYLKTLRNRITGFATATTLEVLAHLYTAYGRLTPADLQGNDTCLRQPYDPN